MDDLVGPVGTVPDNETNAAGSPALDQGERPSVLLLGTFHMAPKNLDYANVQVDDVRSKERQREIRECVERLERFRPTKVAVEVTSDKDGSLNEEYQRYRAGAFELSANEVHQLGVRIAAEMGHDRAYPIDWMGGKCSGHLPLLTHYIRESGAYRLETAQTYLC